LSELKDQGFHYKGVIEGFYGKPWSHSERLSMLEWLSKEGYNAFLYAPKNDLFHRARWREPYPEDEMHRFKELVSIAKDSQIDFILGISPGLSLKYSDENELVFMWEKMRQFLDIGVRTFGLFFDDIPFELQHEIDRERYQDLAHAQVDFTQHLFERCKREGIHLIICPTHYFNNPEVCYLETLGELLDPIIDIFWTGPDVCSRTISGDHLEKVASVMKRPALIWDNYPVNDVQMTSELHIGPYSGREKSMISHSRGVFLNPMNQPNASRIALACASRFFENPDHYEPEAAWAQVIEELLGQTTNEKVLQAFFTFSKAVSISPLSPDEPSDYAQFVNQWNSLKKEWRNEEAIKLIEKQSQLMKVSYTELISSMNENPILKEMLQWISDYGKWANALEVSAEIMRERDQYDQFDDEEDRIACKIRTKEKWEELAKHLCDSIRWPTRTCGDVLRIFLLGILRHTQYVLFY
jgi:hyaluronoglucosaminidase